MKVADWIANLYRYRGKVSRVIDGDTLVVMASMGLDVYHEVTLRLAGVNTPEITGPDRIAGKAAKVWMTDRVLGRTVYVQTFRDRRSFTRYVAVVLLAEDDGTLADIATELITAGLAVPTDDYGHLIVTGGST